MFEEIRVKDIDVLVIGGGLAGVYAAIKAKEAGASCVVLVDKGKMGKSGNSCFAAGVMHVFFPQEDDLEDRVRRLTRSLGYLARQDMIKEHLEQSFVIVKEMDKWGVDFLKGSEGNFERRPGRGYYPVVMFRGTQMMETMRKVALKSGVKEFSKIMITDLLTQEGRVAGAVGFHIQMGDFYIFEAKTTILATGSTWYKGLLPGHRDCTGDGYAAAFRAGAELSGAENNDMLTNLMPARYDIGPGMNKFVGEGGIFLNAKGERFMEKYNPSLKERAGLRILTSAFCLEAKQGNVPIYMDMTHFNSEQVKRLKEVLPLAMKMFERVGIVKDNRFIRVIEWMPCAPVARPGLIVNNRFETSLPGLYACGEAAAPQAVVTGLAAAATSGAKAGRSAAEEARKTPSPSIDLRQVEELKKYIFQPLRRKEGMEPDQVLLALQESIIPYDVLLLREEKRMKKALKEVEDIRNNQVPLLKAYDPHYLRMVHEVINLALVAEIHLRSALMREESRVALREDYPYTDNLDWLKWIKVKKEDNQMSFSTEEIPIEQYPIKVEKKKILHHLWKIAEEQKIIKIEEGKVKWV
jgi:succinate dehydrogenase/fumarate reductase flavoprotein subunit